MSQIAEELERTPQAIYHHIRKLREAGMVEVAREERVDHFIETYYQATAELFHLAHGKGGSKEFSEGQTRDVLTAIGRLGLSVQTDPESVSKIVDLQRRIGVLGSESELTEKLAKLEDVDFITKQQMFDYVKLLTMSNEEFDEQAKLMRELRKLLKSRIVDSVKA